MDKAQLLELLDVGPVIASVKDEAGLSAALKSDVGVIFLLFGDVLNIGEMVGRPMPRAKRYSSTWIWWMGWPPGR